MTRSIATIVKYLVGALGSFVLWTCWLLLAAMLTFLLVIACSHELSVPNRLVQHFRDRLAVAGLRFTFDTAHFDLRGNVLVENLQVYSDTFEEPLITCESIYLRIDPWALTAGSFEVDSIVGHQTNLYVPAMLSPSGQSEAVIRNLEFALAPANDGLAIQRLVAQAGQLTVTGRGNVARIRTSVTEKSAAHKDASHLLADYLNAAKLVARWEGKLNAFEEPTLRLTLDAHPAAGAQAQITLSARSADLTAKEFQLPAGEKTIHLHNISLSTVLPLKPPEALRWIVNGSVESAEAGSGPALHALNVRVTGRTRVDSGKTVLDDTAITLGDVSAHQTIVKGIVTRAQLSHWPEVQLEFGARVADENVSLTASGDLLKGAIEASASALVSPALIDLVDTQAHQKLSDLLTLSEPVPVRVQANLAEHWKLSKASAHFDARNVNARDVALVRAVADVDYDGQSLLAKNIILQQAANLAEGSYWMDLKTLDYRFLLTGVLRPNGIDGWFHDWWPRFWSRFDFTQAAPTADIDVQGRWRAPHLSNLFLSVEVNHPKINDVPFDLVRTSLFIRPDFYDAPVVFAKRGSGEARGHFTRSVDLDQGDFKSMEFDVQTNLPLEVAKVFGEDGTDIVEPFVFVQPANLHIVGRLEGDASPNGPHQNVTVDVDSTGEFKFFDFPLSDLHCEAVVKDRVISVSDLKVGFAGGTATGQAVVSGKEPDRHLKFDTDLHGANLGQAIHVLEDYSAHLKGQTPSGPSLFQERLTKGRLDLRAAAEGGYHNLLTFVGAGHAELHNGELGEINLLGTLSSALRGNSLLGFTSWNLDTAKADFTLERDKLDLLNFQLTGPTAKIEGKGTVSMATKTINVHAKFYPFDEGKTLLANAVGFVLTPVSTALSLKLSGSLSKPKWFFEYGPTNFFRKIAKVGNSAENAEEPTTASATSPATTRTTATPTYAPPPPPPPFLRRRD